MSLSKDELDRLDSIDQKLELMAKSIKLMELSYQQILLYLTAEDGLNEIEKTKKKKFFFW